MIQPNAWPFSSAVLISFREIFAAARPPIRAHPRRADYANLFYTRESNPVADAASLKNGKYAADKHVALLIKNEEHLCAQNCVARFKELQRIKLGIPGF